MCVLFGAPVNAVCRKSVWNIRFPVYSNVHEMPPILCTLHIEYLLNATYPVHRKCVWNTLCTVIEIPCVLGTGNVDEIPCIQATRNVHEIVPYTVSGNVQEVSKYLVVRNVHSMNRKCDQSYTFLGDFHT